MAQHLTPWNKTLPENVTVPQAIKNSLNFTESKGSLI
jgi:hypothetical protein